MGDPEATQPQTQYRKTQDKKVFLSPLALYQKRFCRVCIDADYCNANTQRRLTCILCAMLDTALRTNQLKQQRGAHL